MYYTELSGERNNWRGINISQYQNAGNPRFAKLDGIDHRVLGRVLELDGGDGVRWELCQLLFADDAALVADTEKLVHGPDDQILLFGTIRGGKL